MNLYLLCQNENQDYDTFDSCVVCAENAERAKLIHPYMNRLGDEYNSFIYGDKSKKFNAWDNHFSGWATHPNNVECTLIGIACDIDGVKPYERVIASSFNAG